MLSANLSRSAWFTAGELVDRFTEVRPLVGDRDRRDERHAPERLVRAVHAGSAEAAGRIAQAFRSLGMVRAGRLRVKVFAPDGARRSELARGTDMAPASRGLDGA